MTHPPWNQKYWDILDQIYWTPGQAGFESIPAKRCVFGEDTVTLPQALIAPGSSLYRRVRNSKEQPRWLLTQEEILNQVFNLAFAIAPDALIAHCLAAPLGFSDPGPFLSLGRDMLSRYNLGNVTRQDGFFVGPNALIGVELKLGAPSTPDQLAKYAALFFWEERLNGPRERIGLLYIVPDNKLAGHWKTCRLPGPQIDRTYIPAILAQKKLSKQIRRLYETETEALARILDRMQLALISWTDLHTAAGDFARGLDPARAGDQALRKLIDGLCAQIEAQAEVPERPA
jgi:hypothetical protein